MRLNEDDEKKDLISEFNFPIIFFDLVHRLREERVDDRNQISEQKSREHTSHNGKLFETLLLWFDNI